jgi:endonuclease G
LENVFQECPDTEILKGLQIKPAAVASAESKAVTNQVTALKTDGNSPVTISLPTSLIQSHGQISITINNGSGLQPVPMAPPAAAGTETVLLDAQEIKKLEQETDYAQCRGYQSHFLGIDVPLPQPKPAYRKLIAKQKANNKIELAYYNYSVIFHALRKMPIISAVNVEGNLAQRTDKQARKDNWLRDNRISFDIQLGDAFYKASGFDRGHMSRREDAYWGDGPEDAKRNADLTCTYTNACPQAPTINQSQRNGLWGQLEKVVLENGAERESGRTTRISVFNGPIFKDSDPVFRGVHVPMDFYKIVLWLTDAGGLKATAFVLSQEKEVGDINFEQLDIDENTQFQAYQCSIQSLEAMTGIDFSGITAYDTFESVGGHEKTAMTATELATHVAKNYKTVA